MFMTIDPGIGGTGYAIWDDGLSPRETGVLVPSKKPYLLEMHGQSDDYQLWLSRTREMSKQFSKLVGHFMLLGSGPRGPRTVYVEYPKLHTSASGMASAQRGDVFKLMFLVGVYADITWSGFLDFVPLEVNQWKGTLSKEAVAKRVIARLGCSPKTYGNHEMDAVGMGLYIKGVLNGSGQTRPKQHSE